MAGARIAAGLDMPEEVVLNVPLVTIRGGESVTVENFKRILGFGNEEAVVLTKNGRLLILGQGLFLEYMRKDVIKIRGRIFEVVIK